MQSVFLNGGYVGVTREYLTKYVPITSFSYVDYAPFAAGFPPSTSVTIPLTAQPGDLAILTESWQSEPDVVAQPTGWNLINSVNLLNNITVTSSYKILESSDIGSNEAIGAGTSNLTALCTIFRPNVNSGISSVTLNDVDGEATDVVPATDTLAMSASSGPIIGIMMFAQRNSNANSFNENNPPPSDGYTDAIRADGFVHVRHHYKIYNAGSSPSDMTGSINDQGAQAIQSFYFTFDSLSGIKQYNSGIWELQSVLEAIEG